MRTFFLALIFLCAGFCPARASVTLPAVFSDHMVLQQQANVLIWGKTRANATVRIQTGWNGRRYKTRAADDGSFRLRVSTPAAGGPFRMVFDDGERVVLDDILIGEVWLCSGQSNMEMPVKGFANQPVVGSNDLLTAAAEPGVRLFRVEKNMSKTPLTQLNTSWQLPAAASVKEFSAIGYQFARMLQRTLGVPVGIISSAYGGTDIEAWMDQAALAPFKDFPVPADSAKINKNHTGVLYNAMINPIAGFHIRGVLWYQGENNRVNPATYDRKMAAMVSLWRRIWDCGEWPFYYVQIAPNKYKNHKEQIPLLYEAQQRAMSLIPNAGMAVSVDAGSMTTIHPPDKTIISKRLLYWALARTYGREGIAYQGPVYRDMKVNGAQAVLAFDNIPLGLTAYDQKLLSFEVAGHDRVFYPAEARISGKTIVVQSEQVKLPQAVRYAFKDTSAGNLYNTEGLPAAPFRTDNW
ncbi:sialate O-acetylesterase [Pedobacter yulinensis]|uniref:Sialate O-acetylesterase n=1 Tax=Pedobacter yulinensis TaxID=2126353 RepID=A0A2T3HMA5_9SPHI|nr:sialate O-acetylesterase [Pedobacter yulinensis]PST83567.1 sialate O-acetylesterase [Pedobacter yulinensis]